MKKRLKQFLAIGVPALLLGIAVFIIGPACSTGPVPTVVAPCDTANSAFRQLYLNSKNTIAGSADINSWDLLIHEYSFKVAVNKTICAIGYQGNAAVFAANVPYIIEISNSTGTVLFTSNFIFNSTRVDYRSISPVVLTANQTYFIKRKLTNNLGNLNNNLGKVLTFTTANHFPVTFGDLTLTSSNFYDFTAVSSGNFGIPFIDIVFQ
ncbi:MAG: hypothetical protein ABI685_09735 [Ferruginibacter sp.]